MMKGKVIINKNNERDVETINELETNKPEYRLTNWWKRVNRFKWTKQDLKY